ncbi:hypothetical protein [Tessaracoccus coleopterorum]|uniref:hypothetical protein n=1 Tax=Tessaracoccus coleopterorum TaxID=2714950 RepID=UPI001E28A474|nr:hypothetical protein [Tessaracoccus coleopterorum]
MSILQAYNIDNLDVSNAYKVDSGATIFSTPESQVAMDKYLELFKTGSPESSVAWATPRWCRRSPTDRPRSCSRIPRSSPSSTTRR